MVMQARFELGTSEADLAEGMGSDYQANLYHGITFRDNEIRWGASLTRDNRMDFVTGELVLGDIQFEAPPLAVLHGGYMDIKDRRSWFRSTRLGEQTGTVSPLAELERIFKPAPQRMHLSELYADGTPVKETDSETDLIKKYRRDVTTFYSQYQELAGSSAYKLGKPLLEQSYLAAKKCLRPFDEFSTRQPQVLARVFGAQLLAQLENAYGKIPQW